MQVFGGKEPQHLVFLRIDVKWSGGKLFRNLGFWLSPIWVTRIADDGDVSRAAFI